jgi:hypothetical protein
VVDGDALEMRFGETQRGFESPPLRFNLVKFVAKKFLKILEILLSELN